MRSKNEFEIAFEGLKLGKHNFEFTVTDTFFEGLTYSIINGGRVTVDFILDKKESMMIGMFEMSGTVRKLCDRCAEPMDVPVHVSENIVYKFSDEEYSEDNLILIPSSAFSIDISPSIYELLTVSLPSRTIHKDNECSEEMLQLLNQYVKSSEDIEEDVEDIEDIEEDMDPRWDVLKNINKNKK